MRYLFLIVGLLIAPFSFSQSYNGPESVEFNPNNGSYYISNSSNGQILELDANNDLSVFVNNTGPGPHGLELVGDTLYACSGGRLKGYSINNFC